MNAAARPPELFEPNDAGAPQRDPFQTRYDDACYFDEAVRAKRLNLLLHLIPYSDVLLVTGEPGSGKTFVLNRLLAGANHSWRICRVQATPEIDGERLIEILSREFSLRPDDSDDVEQRLRLLRESLHALRHSALIPVLVIDDAHLLTHAALVMLTALTEPWEAKDKLLSVVMFSEPEITKRLIAPGLEALRARVSHTFDIPPLSQEDTGRYIRHRLQAAGLAGAGPFTDAVIKFIHVASRGIPGRINEFARVVLNNSEQKLARAAPPVSLGSRARVYVKYGIAAALASAAAVGLLYQDRLMEMLGRRQDTVTPAAVPPVALAPAPGGSMPREAEPPVPDADAPAATEESGALPPVPAMVEEPAASAPEPAAAPSAIEPAADAAPAEPEAETAAVAPAATPVAAAPTAPRAAPPETVAVSTIVAPTGAPAPPREDDWLLAQDPDTYTLQLLVASRAQCLAYIERHGLGNAAALYQTRSAGQEWTSLVYGIFATEADADDAAKAILEQDVNAKPWVRKLGLVQARIREFRAGGATAAPVAAGPVTSRMNSNNKGVSLPPGQIRREAWLLEQAPEAYTLQLVSGTEANVMDYLKRHALTEQVALYRPHEGEGRLTVTYGIYPDRVEAARAAKELTARLLDLKPWVRTLREIQAIIAAARDADVSAPPEASPPQANQ